jgi:aspartyl-tRNA(Asn)/glutamyl-tRNA(Gln) amidotransferase subunit A
MPSRRRLSMIAAVEDVLCQVLLCASAMDPPSRIDEVKEIERTYPRQARTPFNVTGHPALVMMCAATLFGSQDKRRLFCRSASLVNRALPSARSNT